MYRVSPFNWWDLTVSNTAIEFSKQICDQGKRLLGGIGLKQVSSMMKVKAIHDGHSFCRDYAAIWKKRRIHTVDAFHKKVILPSIAACTALKVGHRINDKPDHIEDCSRHNEKKSERTYPQAQHPEGCGLTGWTDNRANGCVHWHVHESPLPEEEKRSESSGIRTCNPTVEKRMRYQLIHMRCTSEHCSKYIGRFIVSIRFVPQR